MTRTSCVAWFPSEVMFKLETSDQVTNLFDDFTQGSAVTRAILASDADLLCTLCHNETHGESKLD